MNAIQQRKWYFKHGTCYELFNVLFDNGRFMLVQNVGTKHYSFGPCADFGTLCGFPVSNSCLTLQELIDRLDQYIAIDSKPEYACVNIAYKEQFGYSQVEQWEAMKQSIK